MGNEHNNQLATESREGDATFKSVASADDSKMAKIGILIIILLGIIILAAVLIKIFVAPGSKDKLESSEKHHLMHGTSPADTEKYMPRVYIPPTTNQ